MHWVKWFDEVSINSIIGPIEDLVYFYLILIDEDLYSESQVFK